MPSNWRYLGLIQAILPNAKIVDVTGGASDGAFTLVGDYDFEGSPPVITGAYGYRLFQGGVATPTDGDRYLRSALLDGPDEPAGPLYQPGAPLYESYAQVLRALNDLPTLQERIGNRRWAAAPAGEAPALWGRIEGSRIDLKPRLSTTSADTELASWKVQIGFDQVVSDGEDSTVIAGLTAHYADGNADVSSVFGNGSIDTSAYGFGATLTWFGPDGLYADAQGQFTWFDSDVESDALGALTDGNGGKG